MCATTKLTSTLACTYHRFLACICSHKRRSYSAPVARCAFCTGRRRFAGKDKLVSAFWLYKKFPAVLPSSKLVCCGKDAMVEARGSQSRTVFIVTWKFRANPTTALLSRDVILCCLQVLSRILYFLFCNRKGRITLFSYQKCGIMLALQYFIHCITLNEIYFFWLN